MPKIRGNTASKWVRRTASATEEFKDGVNNPRASWQAQTVAAAPAQAAGVQQAIAEKRFEKGVAAAGDAKWKEKTATKGADRFASGVQAGESDYQKGFAPYAQVIENTALPPRGPKGDPKNFQRVVTMATALRNKKLGK
jgi:hypothetical protein